VSVYSRPLPVPSPESEPFWQGLRDDRFLLQHCRACQTINWFPRAFCRNCGVDDFDWRPAIGRGVLETYSIVYRAMNEAWKSEVPYILAWVRLEEGPRMVTRLVRKGDLQPKIDAPVEVRFVNVGGGFKLPYFEEV
jgi:uncharacterized protein